MSRYRSSSPAAEDGASSSPEEADVPPFRSPAGSRRSPLKTFKRYNGLLRCARGRGVTPERERWRQFKSI